MDNQQAENLTTLPTMKKANSTIDSEIQDSKVCELNSTDKVNQPKNTNDKNTGVAIKNFEFESLNSLSSDDEDDSGSSSEDDEEPSPAEPSQSQNKSAIRKSKTTKDDGELSVDQLPPVPDISNLNINVENECFLKMGNILGIVDKLDYKTLLTGWRSHQENKLKMANTYQCNLVSDNVRYLNATLKFVTDGELRLEVSCENHYFTIMKLNDISGFNPGDLTIEIRFQPELNRANVMLEFATVAIKQVVCRKLRTFEDPVLELPTPPSSGSDND